MFHPHGVARVRELLHDRARLGRLDFRAELRAEQHRTAVHGSDHSPLEQLARPGRGFVCWRRSPTTPFLALYAATTLFALLTAVGLWTRTSSILLAVGLVTLHHRNPLILHGGDTVLRLGCSTSRFPLRKACSFDRLIGLWQGKIAPGPVAVSLWPQRLITYNVALILT